ncbi:MAG: hypothetical protein RLZZ518_1431 [Actinomycetota bacterium]
MSKRSWRTYALAGFAGLALLGAAPSVSAQVSDDLGVIGQLQYQDASGQKVLVAGVDLSIDDVGGATTDKDGSFRIAVPGPGEYSIRLDVATLPAGVTLRDPDRAALVVNVSENQDQRIIFPLITGDTVVASV